MKTIKQKFIFQHETCGKIIIKAETYEKALKMIKPEFRHEFTFIGYSLS